MGEPFCTGDGVTVETLTIFNHDGTTAKLAVVDKYVSKGNAHVMRGVMFIGPELGRRMPAPDTTFTVDGNSWPAWSLDDRGACPLIN